MALTKERLEQLLAPSTATVVATDARGTVIYYNDGARRTRGYTVDEILGKYVVQLYPDRKEAKRVMAAMRDPAHGGAQIVETFRTTFVSKSGEHIPVAISGTILHDESGKEDGTIGFAKDLREILHKDKLATLGEVAIGLSHEINNPLAVIVNQAELLERDLLRLAGEADISVESERIDAVRREVARISEILERVGEMAREDTYQTVDYIGPARMLDLRRRARRPKDDLRMAGLRVLVADDDLGIRLSLSEILRAEGCEVETAGDGAEALSRLESGRFDLVLTDVVMPKMDGYELLRAVQERHPGIPVLMMTAFHYDRDHTIKRSRMLGLEGVIFKKPVDPQRLRQVILETVVGPGAKPRGGPSAP